MRTRLLVDGRIFSLQQKGGISVLWTRILSHPAIAARYSLALALYPGAEKNIHLAATLPALEQRMQVIRLPMASSDNQNFATAEHDAARTAACKAQFGEADLVLNTYYGASLGGDVRQLVVLHDMAHEELPDLRAKPSSAHVLKLKRAALDSAATIVCISMATRAGLMRAYGNGYAARTCVVYHGHDRVPQVNRERSVVHIGTRAAYKRFDVLNQAAAKVLPGSGWRLKIVGGEPFDAELSALRAQLGSAIDYVAQPSDEEVNRHIASAGIYVSSSVFEGFGLPLLQAMASDTRSVVSDIPVYREIGGAAARYFSAGDAGALATALQAEIAAKDGFSRTFGVRRDWSDVVAEYVKLIDHVVAA